MAVSQNPLHPVPAWLAILAFVGCVAIGLLAHLGGIVRLLYPAGCVGVGAFLYWRYPILYLGFTWWVWFLSPFVRRVVDWQSGWVDPSPVLLAPFLTTLITAITFLNYLPKVYRRQGLPFVLAVMGVLYGLAVGMLHRPVMALVVPTLNWLTPVLFGFHLAVHWRDYPKLQNNLRRTFVWGVLVIGIYGVVQYLVAPSWDRFWLQQQDTPTFGIGEPLGIRVFSTMNSPQPFAFVLGAGLILLVSSQSKLRFVAAGAGYLSFLLSLARSAWLGWLVSLLLLVPSLKPRLQMQVMVSLLVMGLLVVPLTQVEPFSEVIQTRVQTLVNVKQDQSFSDRSQGYNEALGVALNEFVGRGLGSSIGTDALGSNDSGVLSVLFSLGWFGTVFYLGGLLLLLGSVARSTAAAIDPFASAARSIAVGAIAQIGLNNITVSVFGITLWGFLGIAAAAQRYHWHQQQQSRWSIDPANAPEQKSFSNG